MTAIARTLLSFALLGVCAVAWRGLAVAQDTPPENVQPLLIDSLRKAAEQQQPPEQEEPSQDQPEVSEPAEEGEPPQNQPQPAEGEQAPPEQEQPSLEDFAKTRQPSAAQGGDELGFAVAATGDLNRDGTPDYAVGAFAADSGGINAGSIIVISGRGGDTLLYLKGEDPRENLGWAIAAADIDNDGTADLIAGAPHFSKNDSTGAQVGRVYVFSGADGTQLRRVDGTHQHGRLGYTVASVGDVDGDGYADYAVGEFGYADSASANLGAVHVYSGQSGEEIRTFVGSERLDRFGGAIADVGDVDADGTDDLLIGARRHSAAGLSAGRVYLFSGKSGDSLLTLDGHALFEQFGAAVAGVGDINGDNTPDFAVGAPESDEASGRGGCVYFYSGRNGSLLYRRQGEVINQVLGCALAGCGDLNEDGIPDLLAGSAGRSQAGRDAGAAYVLSGADASVVREFAGEAVGDNFGRAVACPGDLDGDGVPDLLVGAFGNDDGGIDAGKVYLYSGRDFALLASVTGTSNLSAADTATAVKPPPVIAAAAPDTGAPVDSFVMPDTVYNIEELDNPPFLRRNIEAVYPPSAEGTGATGWVQVRVMVLDDGLPGLIEIADDAGLGPDFRDAAIQAARQWEFAPATKNGKDVASWTVVPIGFAPPDSTAKADSTDQGLRRLPGDTVRTPSGSAPQGKAAAGDTATAPPDTATATPDTATVPPDTATVPPDTATVPPEPVDTTKNYDWSEVDTQPKLVGQVNAEYPVKALADRDTGTVMMRVLVLRDGTVGEANAGRVTNPDKGFEDAAIEAVKKWRFEAGSLRGERVKVWVNYPIRFTLPAEAPSEQEP